ncbi:MAG: FG-GAP repeat protein [Verrucomicrobiae bacterium]|nr:FG-GAP repeat protein [Verrucomicrobiae bacterium]
MNTPSVSRSHRAPVTFLIRYLFLAALLISAGVASAFSPDLIKLHPRARTAQDGNAFGKSVAMSDQLIVVGQPGDDDVADNAGAVHLFDTRGRYLRKLVAPDGLADDEFGASVAICGRVIAVGAPGDDEAGAEAGAVYLFYTTGTSRPFAKVMTSDAADGDRFGTSVALSADRLLAGAISDDSAGADFGSAYVFEIVKAGIGLAIGNELQELSASDGATGDSFGFSVDLCGRVAVVGAPLNATGQGAAYLYDIETGVELGKLTASDGGSGHVFGWSVAIESGRVLVGAPDAFTGAGFPGAAYLFEVSDGSEVTKLIPDDGVTGDHFGRSVALTEHLALAGAPDHHLAIGTKTGSAYLYELPGGTQVSELHIPNGEDDDRMGSAVALCGNLAVIGMDGDDDNGNDSGSATIFDPVNGKLPMMSVMKTGDFAPEVPGGLFNRPQSAVTGPLGATLITGTLKPVGTKLGGGGDVPPAAPVSSRDTGAFSTMAGQLDLLLKSRDQLTGGETVSKVMDPIFNQASASIFQGVLSRGAGVTSANNRVIFGDDGFGVAPVIRTGTPLTGLLDSAIQKIKEVVQPRVSPTPQVGIAYTLKMGTGSTPVTRANDSGALLANLAGALTDAVPREGDPIPFSGGAFFGQNLGRVSVYSASSVSTAAYQTAPGIRPVMAVMSNSSGNWLTSFFQNHPALVPTFGTVYGALLGETMSSSDTLIYRTTLKGTGTTARNNEALFQEFSGAVARKGDEPDPSEPGVTFKRILRYWPGPNDQVIFLASIGGRGVSAANDVALYLFQENGEIFRLMREGDYTCACDCPRIRSITRVDVDPVDGRYVVLASLVSSPKTNLALFTGGTNFGNATDQKARRLPSLRLRKGTYYQARPGDAARILSLTLPTTMNDRLGAGGKGLGQVINETGDLTVTIKFDDRTTEVMTGMP